MEGVKKTERTAQSVETPADTGIVRLWKTGKVKLEAPPVDDDCDDEVVDVKMWNTVGMEIKAPVVLVVDTERRV